MTEHRYVSAVAATLATFTATGWWGIPIFATALDQLWRYHNRLSTRLPDPSIWRTPLGRWQTRTGLDPEPDNDNR